MPIKLIGLLAIFNSTIGLFMLMIGLGLIGFSALANPNQMIDLASNNPATFLIQDTLKFVSAVIFLILLILLFFETKQYSCKSVVLATFCGLVSVLCFLGNATVSFILITQAEMYGMDQIESLVLMLGLFGMGAILFNGIWYLILNWVMLKNNRIPQLLGKLGILIGCFSLLPPLGLFVLFLSIVWWFWLGIILLRHDD